VGLAAHRRLPRPGAPIPAAVARRYADSKSPLAAYAKIPRSYLIVQRINLGVGDA